MNLKRNRRDGVVWIHLAQDRDQWRATVNMVMNIRCTLQCRKLLDYLSDCQLLKKDLLPQSEFTRSWTQDMRKEFSWELFFESGNLNN